LPPLWRGVVKHRRAMQAKISKCVRLFLSVISVLAWISWRLLLMKTWWPSFLGGVLVEKATKDLHSLEAYHSGVENSIH
jgi:hypothetical protein